MLFSFTIYLFWRSYFHCLPAFYFVRDLIVIVSLPTNRPQMGCPTGQPAALGRGEYPCQRGLSLSPTRSGPFKFLLPGSVTCAGLNLSTLLIQLEKPIDLEPHNGTQKDLKICGKLASHGYPFGPQRVHVAQPNYELQFKLGTINKLFRFDATFKCVWVPTFAFRNL